MSIFTRLLCLRIPIFPKANAAPKVFAAVDTASSKRRPRKIRQRNLEMSPNNDSAVFGGRVRTVPKPPDPAAPRFLSAHFDIHNRISDTDVVRFRSDLEAMLHSLSEGEMISSRFHAPSPRLRQDAHMEHAPQSFDARSSLEADVADAVRKLSTQPLLS